MQHRVLVPVSHPLGGIRTYMLYSFRRLHEKGVRFTFLSSAGEAFRAFKKDVEHWIGTEFIDSPEGNGSKAAFLTIRRALKERQFTLIHSQGLRAGTEAAAANYFRQIPHLITLHDVIVPRNDIPGPMKQLKKAVISAVVRRASVVVPVSEDCAANHLEVFPAWKKGPVQVTTILNGIDIDRIDRAREEFESADDIRLRHQFAIAPNIIVGGFFGRFMPQKGFDILLDALSLLAHNGYGDRFRLIVTKDPNGFLGETMQETAERPEVARMVDFIDPVSNIAPLLCQCDVLVMPSRWEACGLLAMEAMVLGKPVIGSNCLGLREVLNGTPSLLAPKENAEALAEKLIEFIENPTTESARNYVPEARRRFDVNVATARLAELYRRFE